MTLVYLQKEKIGSGSQDQRDDCQPSRACPSGDVVAFQADDASVAVQGLKAMSKRKEAMSFVDQVAESQQYGSI
jgi:hypothetical protein